MSRRSLAQLREMAVLHACTDPLEADDRTNNLARAMIGAMREESGRVWLGKINLYDGEGGHPEAILREWDGSLVCNFSCSFIVPVYDEELVQLIHARDTATYTGTTDDARRLDAIFDRLQQVGGCVLFWS